MGRVPPARKGAGLAPRHPALPQGKDTKEAEGTNVAYAMLQRERPGPLSSAPEPARLDCDPPTPTPAVKRRLRCPANTTPAPAPLWASPLEVGRLRERARESGFLAVGPAQGRAETASSRNRECKR